MARKAPRLRAGAVIPDSIDTTGLRLVWVPDDGGQRVINLDEEVGSETLRRQAVRALKVLTATDGPWRRLSTVTPSLRYVRHLLRWCDQRSITSFAEFEQNHYAAYVEEMSARDAPSSHHSRLVAVRPLLRAIPEVPQTTRWLLQDRVGAPERSGERTYYTRSEFRALEQAAQRVLAQARRRVQTNYSRVLTALETTDISRSDEVLVQHFLYDPTSTKVRKRWLGDPSPAAGAVIWNHFFMLTPEEALAATVLLVCRNGWNLSPMLTMTTGDTTASLGQGQNITTVSLDKARRGHRRHSTSVLVDDGLSSDGAAWRLVVEATQPAREFLNGRGVNTNALLVFGARGGMTAEGSPLLWKNVRTGIPKDVTRQGVSWLPDGLSIDFPQLRRTYQTLISRAPKQNTMQVHVNGYLSLSPEVRAEVEETVAAGQMQLLARAEESVVLRLEAEADVEADIAGGLRDTATAACRDITQHPVTGEVCTDSFLMCLMCTNAVATPRHLPRLVLLHQALEDQRSALSDQAWTRWRDHYLRLTAFLFNVARVTDDTYRTHLQAATEQDRRHVRDLLGGHLDASA